MFNDFMRREGIILIVVVGGFFLANKYNRILDELDLEIANKAKFEKKAKRKAKKEQRL